MKQHHESTLSTKRIILTTLLFISIPILTTVLDVQIDNHTLAMMFAFNFAGWAMVIYDWNLFALHYNRAKNNLNEMWTYFGIGFIFIGILAFLNIKFLHGFMILPDHETIAEYPFAYPAILAAYTYIQALIINISFKCLTDHFDIEDRELFIIIMSGLIFGTMYTLFLTPPHAILLLKSLIYNILLVSLNSYLYNQSGSFIPGILATGSVYLVIILAQLY